MIKIMHGNVLDKLKILENESVNCVVTSPPYWRLRDYGSDQQIGLEAVSYTHLNLSHSIQR